MSDDLKIVGLYVTGVVMVEQILLEPHVCNTRQMSESFV